MSCNLYFPYEPSLGTATPGGATTLSNVGGGADLVNTLSGGNYPIKTLVAGTNTSLIVGANTITINSTGGITNGTATDNSLRWNGTNWVENANLKFYSDGKVRMNGVTTGGTLEILQVTGTDPFLIWAGATTRYMSMIDNTSGLTEFTIYKGGSTYQKGNAVLDNNSGLQLAELDANGSGTITIKSNANMGSSSYTVSMPAVQGGANTYLKNDGSGNLTWDTISGGVTGASNVGTGDGWWKDNSSGTLRFKSILVGNGLTKSAGANEITISMPPTSGDSTLSNSGGVWTASSFMRVGTGGSGTGYVGIQSAPSTTAHLTMSAATGKIVQFLQSFANNDILNLSKGGSTSGYPIRINNDGTSSTIHITSLVSSGIEMSLGAANTNPFLSCSTVGGGGFFVYNTGNINTTGSVSLGTNKQLLLNGDTVGGSRVNLFATAGAGTSYNLYLPLNQGGAGTVLQNNGSGVITWATVGGLTYWTESEYTYSGKTGTKLIPNSVNTNQDVVLSPKGTGSIIAQQPDGTATGGNNRGFNAVDLQMLRSANSKVASGSYSVVAGGFDNAASSNYSVVVGGYGNTASAYAFIGGGYSNQVSGSYSVVAGGDSNYSLGTFAFIGGGYSNEVNSNHSTIAGGNNSYIGTGAYSAVVGGDTNTINGTGAYSFIGGGKTNSINATALHYNFIGAGLSNSIQATQYASILAGTSNIILANADYSTIIGNNCKAEAGGKYSVAMGNGAISKRYGERVMSSGALQTLGDNSFAEVQLLARTTSATPQEMYCGGVSGERFAISLNSTTLVKYRWVRRKLSDNTTIATHDYYVLVDKGATAASINIVAQWEDTCLTPKAGNDGSFVGGVDDIVVSADTTNGTLKFTVTGQATTMLWFLRAEAMEIKV